MDETITSECCAERADAAIADSKAAKAEAHKALDEYFKTGIDTWLVIAESRIDRARNLNEMADNWIFLMENL